MARQPAIRYTPGQVPGTEGLQQFFYDELWRIAAAINVFTAGIAVIQSAPRAIAALPVTYTLFIGSEPQFDVPGGDFDSATGAWRVPVRGIYVINVNSEVEPFGSGNKDYACRLVVLVDGVPAFEIGNSGDDGHPLGTSLGLAQLLERESLVTVQLTLDHDQFSGTVNVTSSFSAAFISEAEAL